MWLKDVFHKNEIIHSRNYNKFSNPLLIELTDKQKSKYLRGFKNEDSNKTASEHGCKHRSECHHGN